MASMDQTPNANRIRIAFFGLRNAGKSTLVNAFTGQEIADPLAERELDGLLISNYPDENPGRLRPYEARMVLRRH